MRIRINQKVCSGCHICELVCSLSHLGVMNPAKSAVRIQKDDLRAGFYTPVLCLQCKKMKCVEGQDAMEAAERKKFLWPAERESRCPFDALQVTEGSAYHCDLCGGSPECARFCTTGALQVQR